MSLRSVLQVALLFLVSFQLSSVLAKPTFYNPGMAKRMPTGTGEYQTNAQRLAAGLPPMPPKRRFSPTKVEVVARAASSPTPFVPSILRLIYYCADSTRPNLVSLVPFVSGTTAKIMLDGWQTSEVEGMRCYRYRPSTAFANVHCVVVLSSRRIHRRSFPCRSPTTTLQVFLSSPFRYALLTWHGRFVDHCKLIRNSIQDTAPFHYVGAAGNNLGPSFVSCFQHLTRDRSI